MKYIKITHVRIGLDVKDALSLARKLGCTIVDGGMGRLVSHHDMPVTFNLMMGRREIPIEFVRWLNALLVRRQDKEQEALAFNDGQITPTDGQITPTGQILDDHGREVDEREKQERAAAAEAERTAQRAAQERKQQRLNKKQERQRRHEEERAKERAAQEQRAHEASVRAEEDRSRALRLELLGWDQLDTLRIRVVNELDRRGGQ